MPVFYECVANGQSPLEFPSNISPWLSITTEKLANRILNLLILNPDSDPDLNHKFISLAIKFLRLISSNDRVRGRGGRNARGENFRGGIPKFVSLTVVNVIVGRVISSEMKFNIM